MNAPYPGRYVRVSHCPQCGLRTSLEQCYADETGYVYYTIYILESEVADWPRRSEYDAEQCARCDRLMVGPAT